MRRIIAITVAGLVLGVAVAVSGSGRLVGTAAEPTPKPSPSGLRPLPTPPGGPAPAPVPAPTTVPGSRPDLREYTNARGSWRVELPATWRVFAADDPAGAIITTFDPTNAAFQNGLDIRTRVGVIPRTELRVNVDVWPNVQRLAVGDWIDQVSTGRVDGEVTRLARTNTTIAGQPAVALVQQELSSDRNTRVIDYYILASRDGTRIYVISMHPVDSVRLGEFGALLATFEVLQ